jgi:hypothetical protein
VEPETYLSLAARRVPYYVKEEATNKLRGYEERAIKILSGSPIVPGKIYLGDGDLGFFKPQSEDDSAHASDEIDSNNAS